LSTIEAPVIVRSIATWTQRCLALIRVTPTALFTGFGRLVRSGAWYRGVLHVFQVLSAGAVAAPVFGFELAVTDATLSPLGYNLLCGMVRVAVERL
jgi:hypothetical protein